ncbi:uncharacterized protein LOC134615238 [Pelobates fuscus]|uniref:uncharacterized protein LOC134615238 n=1 Tax=Pelobates fuscus TaxID=191477 RepID=UPI002FE43C0E
MFKKNKKQGDYAIIPGWEDEPYASIASEWARSAGKCDPECEKSEIDMPTNLLACLKKFPKDKWQKRVRQAPVIDFSVKDHRPHVKVEIYWKNKNVERVTALVDTGAEATLIHGNPKKFAGLPYVITGLGGKRTEAVQTWVELKIGQLPKKKYSVLIVPIPEYIIGIDILKGLTLHVGDGCYSFGTKPYISAKPVVVGKLLMPPVQLPPATKVVHIKQYRIPGGHKEIGETIDDLLKAGVLRGVTTAWNNPVWPIRKTDHTWRMTVDYRELNKHTPPLTAAVPDTVTLIENIQKHPGIWYAVIDLANAFFTIPIAEENQEQFAFTWLGRQYTFTRLPQGYLHSPTICHRLVAEHLDGVKIPSKVKISHYIDDIMMQILEEIMEHMKSKGWEINPSKIQGPAQTVKFLGIQWNKGHREILPKAKQKVLEFQTPKSKKQAQSFIGLFGFWRQHIPHLSQLLSPLYKVTRKKHDFEWGDEQQNAFEGAKQAIQQALDLWPIQDGDIDLNVSVNQQWANWSLWQKQGRTKVPLGFWTRKLPEAGERYPFERQLLACYWALVDTEQMTVGHTVFLRPEIPIMQWVLSSPKTHRIGHAQESSIIKWKWYIQDRAKTGNSGTAVLHEKIADAPIQEPGYLPDADKPGESPVKWGKSFAQLTQDQAKHAWFTDGSAKYIGNERQWKAVSYNPETKKILTTTGTGNSSQYAELYAVFQALKQEMPGSCHIYTDSWSVANGLATWLPTWQSHQFMIHTKEVWGKDLWEQIWEMVHQNEVTVFHVDAHCNTDSLDRLFNSVADEKAKISEASVENSNSLLGLATWAHQKCGHLGEKATHRRSSLVRLLL